jgi:L-asparaginase II
VEIVRGGLVDCVHHVAFAVTDADGVVLAASDGAAELPVFVRSSAKPFQAIPAVADGAVDALGLGGESLAVACASHTGRDEHVAAVQSILEAAGLDAAALRCGDDGSGGGLRHNCSGNHALGLALCVHHGWDTATYLEPDHPLQHAMRAAVAAFAGERAEEAVDGCGMRAYRVSLAAFATMFARLAVAEGPAGRCAEAMREHPELVREAGSIDTELMRAVPGLVAKIGAEACLGIGLADGRGIALKVLDGGFRALDPAAVAVLRHLCGLAIAAPALELLGRPDITNARGEVVGEIRVSLLR